jgi:hypothetical protein
VYQAGTSAWRVSIREPLPPLQTKSKGVSISQLLAYQIDIVTYLARHVASSDTANAGISKPSYSRRRLLTRPMYPGISFPTSCSYKSPLELRLSDGLHEPGYPAGTLPCP